MNNDKLLTAKEVAELTSMSRPTIYRKMREGDFPKSRNFGGNLVRWSNNEIQQWIRIAFEQPTTH